MIRRIFFMIATAAMALMMACSTPAEKADISYREGLKQFERHDIKAAIKHLEQAIEYQNDKDYIYITLGHCYMNLQDYDKAIEIYSKAIETTPNSAEAYYSRGLAWFYKGNKDKSCADWHKAHDYGRPNLSDKLKYCP